MIKVSNLHKNYQSHHVLKGLNFNVPVGCVTGLVGPNGSGKSTTIRVLTGFNDADKGEVLISNKKMSVNAISAKAYIGYAPESAPSYGEQTVKEYLTFIAALRGISKVNLNNEVIRVASAFSLISVLKQGINKLSKGYRHRVCLAQCLIGDPPIIVLDEPTDGLDPIQKIETRKIILELAKNKAVLLTTHLLEEVEMLCDRVVLLDNGNVAYAGPIETLIENNRSTTTVRVNVADTTKEFLQPIFNDLTHLISKDYCKNDNNVLTTLMFNHVNASALLNEISLRLFKQNLRIIELRYDAESLINVFANDTENTKKI
uniref:ABC trnasporter ATP-Binding protein n=1 Tax=Colwellia sp. An23 TaxID=1719924 RepID=A0A125T5C8_9GAMM|nr:ABC trnasporter ATP-Binding protein [Colwellia sp. An23]